MGYFLISVLSFMVGLTFGSRLTRMHVRKETKWMRDALGVKS